MLVVTLRGARIWLMVKASISRICCASMGLLLSYGKRDNKWERDCAEPRENFATRGFETSAR